MPISLTTLLEELESARHYEEIRIAGFKILLSFPNDVLDNASRTEINEALTWSNKRLALINTAYAAVDNLLLDGYPDRLQQIAAGLVIKQFENSLSTLRLAVDEFDEPPAGTLDVSEEIPI